MDRIDCSREDLFAAANHFALMQMVALNMLEENPALDKVVCEKMDKLFSILSEKQRELVNIMVEEQKQHVKEGRVENIIKEGYKFKFEI